MFIFRKRPARLLPVALTASVAAAAVLAGAPVANAATTSAASVANFDFVSSNGRGQVRFDVLANDSIAAGLTGTISNVRVESFKSARTHDCPAMTAPTVDFQTDGQVSLDFGVFACDALPSVPRSAELSYTLTDSEGETATGLAFVTEYRAATDIAAIDDSITAATVDPTLEITPGTGDIRLPVFDNDSFGQPGLYNIEIVEQPATGRLVTPSLWGNGDYWAPDLRFRIDDTPTEWVSSEYMGGDQWKHRGPVVSESITYRLRLRSDPEVVTQTATVTFAYAAAVRTNSSTPPAPLTPFAPVITAPAEVLVSDFSDSSPFLNTFPLSVSVPGVDPSKYTLMWTLPAGCSVYGGLPWNASISASCTRIPDSGAMTATVKVTETATGLEGSTSVSVPVRLPVTLTAPDSIVDSATGQVSVSIPRGQAIQSMTWTIDHTDNCKIAPLDGLAESHQTVRCDGYTGPITVTAVVAPLVDGIAVAPVVATKTVTVEAVAATRLKATSKTSGRYQVISYALSTTTGHAVSGQTVLLEKRTATGAWVKVKVQTRTHAAGAFTVPAVYGTYRVRALSGNGFAATTSATVVVRAASSIKVVTQRRALTPCVQAVGVRGCVVPATTVLYKQASNGRWVRVKTVRVTNTRCVSASAAARIAGCRVPVKPGRYKFVYGGTKTIQPVSSGVYRIR